MSVLLVLQIKPLVEPTKLIMKVSVNNYDWHELFPEGNSSIHEFLCLGAWFNWCNLFPNIYLHQPRAMLVQFLLCGPQLFLWGFSDLHWNHLSTFKFYLNASLYRKLSFLNQYVLMLYRSISWIHRYGILFSVHFLVDFMVSFNILER